MKKHAKRIISICMAMLMIVNTVISMPVTTRAASTKPTSLKLSSSKSEMYVGQKMTLKVKTVKPQNASKQVKWSTSNKKIATVSSKGQVTAKKAGTVKITAKSKSNSKVKAVCKITVKDKAKTITLNATKKTLKVGESFTLKVKSVTPKNAFKGVKYKSSKSSIASVDEKGKVTGKKTGRATIIVKSISNSKVKATCKVTVEKVITKTPTIEPTKTATVTIAPTSIIMPTEAVIVTSTIMPTAEPTKVATVTSTIIPTAEPTKVVEATKLPNEEITVTPTQEITSYPEEDGTITPTPEPTMIPTLPPTNMPMTKPTIPPILTVTVVPEETENNTYAGLTVPRTDEKGNVTYDCVYFGNYPQSDVTGEKSEPIKWRVLDINGTNAFLVADQNLDVYQYHKEYENITWKNSTIRSWLNGYGGEENACGINYSRDNFIQKAFNEAEQEAIPRMLLTNEGASDNNVIMNNVWDKIYLLSIEEVTNEDYGFLPYKNENIELNDEAKKRTNTAYVETGGSTGSLYLEKEGVADRWWLRTVGYCCDANGFINDYTNIYRFGLNVGDTSTAVCPALQLNLSKVKVWENAGTITIERENEIPTVIATVTVTPTIMATPTISMIPGKTEELSNPRVDEKGNVTYDCVYFGNYPQSDETGETKEPIKWRVLSVDGTDAFLVADQNLDVATYHEDWDDVTWEKSTIRSWLNGYESDENDCDIDYSRNNFIDQAFTSIEQEAISEVIVANEDNYENDTYAGKDTLDKIYLLSCEEVLNLSYGFLNYTDDEWEGVCDEAKKRTNTAYVAKRSGMNEEGTTDSWWLRTPGYDSDYATYISKNGYVYLEGTDVDCVNAVCPVLHLKISSTNVWTNAGSVSIERTIELEETITVTPIVTITPTITVAPTATEMPTVTPIVTITPTVVPTNMNLNVEILDMIVGDTNVLATVFVPENTTARTVTWTSDKESVAKVDVNGTVTAMGAGTATITATSENGLTATCVVTVTAKTNEDIDDVTIEVTNSLKDYKNTVFTGNDAYIKVCVYKEGQPVGNAEVTLKMEHNSANDYWYICNNQSDVCTVRTNPQGIANFRISLETNYDYDATDGVMGGYLLTATVTGINTTTQAPLKFARLTIGSAKESVTTENYSFSNITVNDTLTDLVQGINAEKKGIFETKTIENKNTVETDNKLIGTSEYVVSQQVSKEGTTDHAVTFDVAPLIQYPEVIAGTETSSYQCKNVSKIYADAKIEWKQVQIGEVGSDAYLYADYQSKVTMTADEAQSYGIEVKNPEDTYYNATVEYKVPTYPHIGNAYVTVTKPNSKEDVTYFMIPTETINNENKLISADKVQAFHVTEEEAMNYVGTVTSTDSTVTINSEKPGITEVYGFLTVPELNCLTVGESRLFAYVHWAPILE